MMKLVVAVDASSFHLMQFRAYYEDEGARS